MTDAVPLDLLDIMPLDAVQVVQVGGGGEALATRYRARNPKAKYVHAASLDDPVEGEGARPDLIIFDDALGRLVDPATTLRTAFDRLQTGGHLAISMSNVAHWSTFVHLLQGRWPSADSGPFDRTRLRFLTLAALGELLRNAGFRIVKARPVQTAQHREMADRWLPALADFAESMGVARAEFLQRASALHYVVLAEKAEAPARAAMHVRMATFAPTLMEARTTRPAALLRSAPDLHVSHVEKSTQLPDLPHDSPKVLVVQRIVPQHREAWAARIALALRAGWLIVAEWDDHPDLVAEATNRTDADNMWISIVGAHGVQTSTDALAAEFRARNPEVAVFPNTAFELPPFAVERAASPRVFFGAANRHRISTAVARAIAPVMEAHADAHVEVVHDRAFFDALPTAAKTFHPTLRYADYLQVMAGCDIALMPLEGRAGERFKSDIKYVEAASRGLAVIASPAIYDATIRDGETGLIARTAQDWAAMLGRLLDDHALRHSLARNAWEEVRDHRMFADQVALRRDWYFSLWQRRAALEADLLVRFPEVAAALGR